MYNTKFVFYLDLDLDFGIQIQIQKIQKSKSKKSKNQIQKNPKFLDFLDSKIQIQNPKNFGFRCLIDMN